MSGEWADQPAADNHGIPGKTLAAAREAMGWSVEQIADQLKMAVRQVVALEAGDYAALPGPAVVRGFVRAYAKVVRLDPVPLVAQIALDAPEAGIAGSIRRDRPASFSEVRFPSHGKRSKLPVMPILAVVLVAAAIGAWQFGLVPASLTGASAPAGQTAVLSEAETVTSPSTPAIQDPSVPLISVPPPATASDAAPGAATPAGAGPVQGVGAAPLAPAATTSVTPPAAAVTAPAVPAATAPAAAGANPLVLNVREDSWVEVRDAQGKALVRRMVKAGETASIEIAGPSTVIVGKPNAVTATLRGAPVALPPMQGSTISRVKVQ
ncbi:helix-turn-helix domain-containing protein [Massilia sp. RP-1-19]|uniref:Helix-turn-helix domain-containing protein n=2 Tax=Massilia polaris TaxID=2728846 RepID=A0A848HJV3_9BURK|nr:helix-turn-helix domain-containing protein [Massilia polaris]